jgi:hypothetical protein
VGLPGDALLARALNALDLARARRDGLVVRTPEPSDDELLDAIAPLLADLLAEMTERQRELGRILILEGGRQAEAAEQLGVSRATVSVMAARGRIRAIERLADAIRAVVGAATATGTPVLPAVPAVPRYRRAATAGAHPTGPATARGDAAARPPPR